jgi:hypothetical protein
MRVQQQKPPILELMLLQQQNQWWLKLMTPLPQHKPHKVPKQPQPPPLLMSC